MKKIQTVLAITLLLLLSSLFYIIAIKTWELFKSIDPTLAAGIIATSATVFVSVFTVMISKKQEHKVEIQAQLRQKKVPIYERIIEFIFLITFADKLGKNFPTQEDMIKFFADTTRDLIIWGSKDMVKAFGDFRDQLVASQNSPEPTQVMGAVEDLLLAVRKDLGHSIAGVKRGDLLRLYVNDVESYFQKK